MILLRYLVSTICPYCKCSRSLAMTDGPLLWLVFRNSLKCTPKQKTNTASGALSPASITTVTFTAQANSLTFYRSQEPLFFPRISEKSSSNRDDRAGNADLAQRSHQLRRSGPNSHVNIARLSSLHMDTVHLAQKSQDFWGLHSFKSMNQVALHFEILLSD